MDSTSRDATLTAVSVLRETLDSEPQPLDTLTLYLERQRERGLDTEDALRYLLGGTAWVALLLAKLCSVRHPLSLDFVDEMTDDQADSEPAVKQLISYCLQGIEDGTFFRQ